MPNDIDLEVIATSELFAEIAKRSLSALLALLILERVAALLGVAQQTVSDWWHTTNTGAGKGCRPDARVTGA